MRYFRIFLLIVIFSVIIVKIDCKGIVSQKKPKANQNNKKNVFNTDAGFYFEGADTFLKFAREYYKSDESILRAFLMMNYSAEVRPVINASSVTHVNITLTVIQIMDLDEQNQVMITNAQIALKWFDEHLVWDPLQFNNQSRIVLSSKDIWTPDIVLFNSADVAYSTQRDNYLIDVQSDGSVMWMFPDTLRSYCRVDIKYFPFDSQNCTLELQSWSRSKKEVIVNFDKDRPFMNHSFINTEWMLLNIQITPGEQNDFVWLEFTLNLKRNHAFYALFVFWLPPDSGEKITLTITILLAITIYLQLITEYTPKAAKSLPIIGVYFNINLILVLISVILTIIVLNFHFRGPKKQRVPRCIRKYVIGYIGRAFCFCYESRAFYSAQEDIKKINKQNQSDKSYKSGKKELKFLQPAKKLNNANSIFSNEYQNDNLIPPHLDFNINNSDENYLDKNKIESSIRHNNRNNICKNAKESHIFLDYSNETEDFMTNRVSINDSKSINNYLSKPFSNLSPFKTSNSKLTANNISPKPDKYRQTNDNDNSEMPFNDEICKNLEKMLNKMQKSFDPFKLQDENLKFAILKEILECQRLLLTANLTSNKEKSISISEIYDEWKILAMIVDRICFFVYLFSLIVSGTIFLVREQF